MYLLFPDKNKQVKVYLLNETDKTEETARKHIPLGLSYVFISELNVDWDFFHANAYVFDSELGAKLDILKAKEIWLNHYRTARTPLLTALDLEYMRADEQGNLELKKQIAVKKQALRDVTKIDLPNTLEELKATWPEILGKNPFSS